MNMFWFMICVFITCVATCVCVLGYKYLDECGVDLSYRLYKEIDQRMQNIEKLLESKNGGDK